MRIGRTCTDVLIYVLTHLFTYISTYNIQTHKSALFFSSIFQRIEYIISYTPVYIYIYIYIYHFIIIYTYLLSIPILTPIDNPPHIHESILSGAPQIPILILTLVSLILHVHVHLLLVHTYSHIHLQIPFPRPLVSRSILTSFVASISFFRFFSHFIKLFTLPISISISSKKNRPPESPTTGHYFLPTRTSLTMAMFTKSRVMQRT